MADLEFSDWDNRPAVLVGGKAFAVLAPKGAWVSVDRSDVFNTGVALSEDAWRKRFVGKFGALDLSKLPAHSGDKPLLRAKDFDDAARAVHAAYNAHNAKRAHVIALAVLAAPTMPPLPHIEAPAHRAVGRADISSAPKLSVTLR
jgi:hypothetical protein